MLRILFILYSLRMWKGFCELWVHHQLSPLNLAQHDSLDLQGRRNGGGKWLSEHGGLSIIFEKVHHSGDQFQISDSWTRWENWTARSISAPEFPGSNGYSKLVTTWGGGVHSCWSCRTSQWCSVPSTFVSFWVSWSVWFLEALSYGGSSSFWSIDSRTWWYLGESLVRHPLKVWYPQQLTPTPP